MNKLKLSLFSGLLTIVCLITACSSRTPNVDLDRVLEVTAATLDRFQLELGKTSELSDGSDSNTAESMSRFAQQLQTDLNTINPQLHPKPIGINLKEDGSIQGYSDVNNNSMRDSGEKELFLVEVDAEKNRLIASHGEYVRDHSFSGSGLLTGLLIGHLLSRQRSAGVNPRTLSSKQAMSKTSYRSARSRSGSGSHSRGK